ncbi:basic salivary proline-rich protein 2-like [Helianthus annuus]|uniref:basic salivary proline-rich protein 2-like n=1 Tax=Helianthus annuus TaxID=4232 RepID=UPI00165330A7|nr:basic salivary proline-rich protein 2-like [Helianthus annuus]
MHQNEKSDHSHHSYLPLQRSGSHRAFQDPTPYFQSQFNPVNQVQEPEGPNPLGPADHYPEMQDMEMDDDPDPKMPPSGTPTHPIEILSGSSFHGLPYRGPDSFVERWATYNWEFTPPFNPQHQQQQDPSEDSRLLAVTPPPPPQQQQPPEPQRRRRSGARMSVHGGFHFSTPQHSSNSHYPPLYKDPQMAAYNSFEQPAYSGYNYYNAPSVDPYLEAANYNTLHPEGPFQAAYPTGYPVYGYQYPTPPQPPQQQPPQI